MIESSKKLKRALMKNQFDFFSPFIFSDQIIKKYIVIVNE